jgi:hypothetical protein
MPGHKHIESNVTDDQTSRLGSEYPFIGPERAWVISAGIAKKAVRDWAETIKIQEVLKRTQRGKNQGTVKTKQKPFMVGGRTTYGALSSDSTHLQNGIDE